jgi:predicted O-methyltransferase YrrM
MRESGAPMMSWQVVLLLALVLVLAVATGLLAWRVLVARAARKQRGILRAWPIPSVTLDAFDPVFAAGPFGPTLETEVQFVGRGPIVVPGGTSDAEAWILAVLAKRARQCFEFGTCTGKTAYLWARNAPADARVVTLTLAPSQVADYHADAADDATDRAFALRESAFEAFLYSGTDAASRIEQLYGDSKQFDEAPWQSWADLVFVDGSHARSYVESDSDKAMRIVKPGGVVLWHDYAGPSHARGVFEALNALHARVPLVHLKGTTFVAWRRPA